MNNNFKIEMLKFPHLGKCECCNRTKDIYYNVDIFYVDDEKKDGKKFLMGDLDLCKKCGENFSKAIGNEVAPNEKVIKEFKF